MDAHNKERCYICEAAEDRLVALREALQFWEQAMHTSRKRLESVDASFHLEFTQEQGKAWLQDYRAAKCAHKYNQQCFVQAHNDIVALEHAVSAHLCSVVEDHPFPIPEPASPRVSRAGAEAYKQGFKLDDNPFHEFKEAADYAAWAKNWKAAQIVDKHKVRDRGRSPNEAEIQAQIAPSPDNELPKSFVYEASLDPVKYCGNCTMFRTNQCVQTDWATRSGQRHACFAYDEKAIATDAAKAV